MRPPEANILGWPHRNRAGTPPSLGFGDGRGAVGRRDPRLHLTHRPGPARPKSQAMSSFGSPTGVEGFSSGRIRASRCSWPALAARTSSGSRCDKVCGTAENGAKGSPSPPTSTQPPTPATARSGAGCVAVPRPVGSCLHSPHPGRVPPGPRPRPRILPRSPGRTVPLPARRRERVRSASHSRVHDMTPGDAERSMVAVTPKWMTHARGPRRTAGKPSRGDGVGSGQRREAHAKRSSPGNSADR